jgi:hypothetical protein
LGFTFLGLPEGMIKFNYSFKTADMIYGPKYELEVKSQSGRVDNVIIHERDYNGPVLGRPAGPPYFNVRRDTSGQVRGTTFELTLESQTNFEYLDFYTEAYKKYKLEYRADNQLKFVGYILPERYSEPYIPPPYDVTVTFTDCLGTLKDIPFTLTGRQSLFANIRHCLDKIGFGIGYAVNVHMWEIGMQQNRSPLEQTFENAEKYQGYSCYQVLENILTLFHATISQGSSGSGPVRWYIERYNDMKRQPFLYDSAGVFQLVGSARTIKQMGTQIDPVGSLDLEIIPASKQLEVRQDYGLRENIIEGDFHKMTGLEPRTHWTWGGVPEGNFEILNNFWDGTGEFVRFTGVQQDTTFTNYIWLSIPVKAETMRTLFRFTYTLRHFSGNPSFSYQHLSQKGFVGMMIYLNPPSGPSYYLHEESGWTQTAHIIARNEINLGSPQAPYADPIFETLSLLADGFPVSGTLFIRLYNVKNADFQPSMIYAGVCWKTARLNLVNPDDNSELPAGYQIFAEGNPQAAESDEAVELMSGDLPDFPNAGIVYRNGLYLADGTLTKQWIIPND